MDFLESMEEEYIVFWKSFNSIVSFDVLMFFSHTFHISIEVLNLDMGRFNSEEIIIISFMIFFSSILPLIYNNNFLSTNGFHGTFSLVQPKQE